ncbi:senecionine N-oxygenase-like [Contarinia nasturtii]|uniref:senecionine N-oxygenase-like n=1 Tax=Contarinia nasturtii TaxID=265458 RepID=UPI0012D45191|nr:senecionine N-oxygenase-like [Contarinia nasturtii]
MYYKLSTNTFYKDMEFPRFHFPSGTEMFPTHDVVWKYLDSYAKSFNLTVHIKYHHLVQKVLAIPDEKWKISVRNLPINRNEKSLFDAVFVCSGINSSPRIPKIKGVTEFKGKIMHSRSYRKPDKFNGECVLVIGSGPSGKDIVDQLLEAGTVNRLTHSYQMPISKEPPKENKFMGKARALCASCFIGKKKNLQSTQESAFTVKGEVKRFTKYGVEFQDGSLQNYTVVIYATGYRYSYPFLDKNTGIHVKDYSVEPLYKHILNIKHTTMAFIGITSGGAHNPMYDLQARFALTFISGRKQLSSYKDMLKDMEMQAKICIDKGRPQGKPHILGSDQKEYFAQLARTAEIENVPDIFADIFLDESIFFE